MDDEVNIQNRKVFIYIYRYIMKNPINMNYAKYYVIFVI